MTILEAKNRAKEILSRTSPSALLDTEILLSHITGLTRTQILFNRDKEISLQEESDFFRLIETRSRGLPVAYITGRKEFFGIDFLVTPKVLIPKPDTEILVEKSIEIIGFLSEKYGNENKRISLCDMCTGSGCIGISVLKHFESESDLFEEICFADISTDALEIARTNAKNNLNPALFSKIEFVNTNLFEKINGTFDLIMSNPPYIPSEEAKKLLDDGRNEPILALDGDIGLDGNATGLNDGLGIIRNLIPQCREHLSEGGFLIVESGEYNAEETCRIFRENNFTDTEILYDLAGQMRDTVGIKSRDAN